MILLTCAALIIVDKQFQARLAFSELERLRAQASKQEMRWEGLQVEQNVLGRATTINVQARGELAMQSLKPEQTLHVVVNTSDPSDIRVFWAKDLLLSSLPSVAKKSSSPR